MHGKVGLLVGALLLGGCLTPTVGPPQGGDAVAPERDCSSPNAPYQLRFEETPPARRVANPWPTSPEQLRAAGMWTYAKALAAPGTYVTPCPEEMARWEQERGRQDALGNDYNINEYLGVQYHRAAIVV